MYTLRQAATMTDTTLHTVRRWVAHGLLPVERVGPLKLKRVRVRRSVLVALFPHANICKEVSQSVSVPLSNR